jgi:hypothetical protein
VYFVGEIAVKLALVLLREFQALWRAGHDTGFGCAVGEQGEEVHIQPITGT